MFSYKREEVDHIQNCRVSDFYCIEKKHFFFKTH